jgi:hypothetical protein
MQKRIIALYFVTFFQSKAETNYLNSLQFQIENNRRVSVTNKDTMDSKT